jgi:hypothetical protein
MLALASEAQTSEHTETIQKIYSLLTNKQFDDAFELAVANQSEFEGAVEFDLAFGIAAKSSSNCSQGLFALERVVQAQPQSIAGRFTLANCYYELGNFPAANSEFSILNQLKLSAELKQLVSQAIKSIEKRVKISSGGWQNAVQINFGMDSNPNNGIEDEFITVPLLGQVRLFEQSREVSSSFYDMSAQVSYFAPINQQSKWYASFGAARTEFTDDDALSRANVNAIAGFKTQLANVDMGTKAFYRPLWLDGDHFLNYFGVIAQASLPILNQSTLGTELTFAKLDYADLSELTRYQIWFDFWFETPTFGGNSRISLKIADEQSDSPQFDFNSRKITGLGYSFTQQVGWQWSYKITADYLKATYDQPHPLFAQSRDDELLQVLIDLNYQWLDDWLLTGQISTVDNTSSLTLYQYNRSNLWLGARYQF